MTMLGRYHLCGIAGVGMSALAEALLDAGAEVTGSDRLADSGKQTPTLTRLARQGIHIFPQDGSGVDTATTAVVVSTAIEKDNPDLEKASSLRIPVRHRSEVLVEVCAGRELIAIAGTCGKSTTTAILGTILEGCGCDPAVVNGAGIVAWRSDSRTGSVRCGTGPCVVEVDESDKSLLRFSPRHAILTNASADHFPLEETLVVFDEFRRKVSNVVIDGILRGTEPPRFERIPWGSRFLWQGQTYTIPVPGLHNGMNAWQAVQMALALGLQPTRIAQALAQFKGVDRRLERIGTTPSGAIVVDDYAHNTEKLRAAWKALQQETSGRVIGLWRPHGYGPLRHMLESLTEMFSQTLSPNDHLFILPVYDAGGTADRSIQSEQLVANLLSRDTPVSWVPNHSVARTHMRALAHQGDILATFGARDPELPETARALV